MKIVLLLGLIGCALALPYSNRANTCSSTVCQLPNCRCSGTDIPGGLTPEETPQFVFLTFDDAINAVNYEQYQEAFTDKTNPDGCPISATYFVSHEYTDYSKLHFLHSQGHEIALHSITHEPYQDYWMNLTTEEHIAEFGGERELISHFAEIDIETIQGMRVPLLQLSDDHSFEALEQIGLTYDCSWPTRQYLEPGLWPYTLDYDSTQDCPISHCPTSSFPGKWVVPMIMWTDDKEVPCSMVDACANIPTETEGIYDFIIKNFNKEYNGNRAPIGFYVHAAWFGQRVNAFAAYKQFIDYVTTLPDVYVVGISRGLEWIRNPKPLSQISQVFPECQKIYEPTCTDPTSCKVMKGEEERYMVVCGDCPAEFPWLGNPLGEVTKA